jgi:hypothetical protein
VAKSSKALKSAFIQTRLTPEERAAVRFFAESQGHTEASFLRMAIRRALQAGVMAPINGKSADTVQSAGALHRA